MPRLVWPKNQCGTGVPEIDRLHQKLCASVDSLSDACRGCRGADEIGQVFEFLSVPLVVSWTHHWR